MRSGSFTIRVYGLLCEHGSVLVSDEVIKGRRITKFPGGGLQFGEGLIDALVREIKEEMDQEALDLEHYYTTDLFQQSTFHSEPMQVISVYYRFRVSDPSSITVVHEAFGGKDDDQEQELFRWLDLTDTAVDALSLPIDQLVFRKLKAER